MIHFFYILLPFFLLSCNVIQRGLEWDESTQQRFTRIDKEYRFQTCNHPSRIQVYSQSLESVPVFENILSKERFKNYNDYDFFVAFTLIQLLHNPQSLTHQSNINLALKVNNNVKIYEFHYDKLESTNSNLLTMLNTILTKHSSKKLEQIASDLDRELDNTVTVGKQLEKFLESENKKLMSDSYYKQAFLKGSQTLRQGETFQRPSVREIIRTKTHSSSSFDSYEKPLFSDATLSENLDIKCSFSIKEYEASNYDISPYFHHDVFDFGYTNSRSKTSFMASFSTNAQTRKLNDHFIQSSKDNTFTTHTCHLSKAQQSQLYTSSGARDNAQILYNILRLNIDDAQKLSDIEERVAFPRRIILNNPQRVIFEKDFTSETQLQEMLRSPIPIYYSPTIGQVFVLYESEKESESYHGIIPDKRVEVGLRCTE